MLNPNARPWPWLLQTQPDSPPQPAASSLEPLEHWRLTCLPAEVSVPLCAVSSALLPCTADDMSRVQLLEGVAARLDLARDLASLACASSRLRAAVRGAAVALALAPQQLPEYDDMRQASERSLQGAARSFPGRLPHMHYRLTVDGETEAAVSTCRGCGAALRWAPSGRQHAPGLPRPAAGPAAPVPGQQPQDVRALPARPVRLRCGLWHRPSVCCSTHLACAEVGLCRPRWWQ